VICPVCRSLLCPWWLRAERGFDDGYTYAVERAALELALGIVDPRRKDSRP
jgi:hypothetical protein